MRFSTLLLVPQLVAAVAITARESSNRAAYFLDNNPTGSSIVALKISLSDGTLSDPVRISTGGKGLFGLGAAPTGPPVAGGADTLFTQDSVVVSQNYLFTVNAGSNTIAMFLIDESDPTHPKLISTAPTLGDFPSSVAYSSHLKTACVINGGAISGVTCFSVTHDGLKPLGGLRSLTLPQTTPPVGPPFTASDILFNPSSTALFVTIKGSPRVPGKVYAFPITSGSIATTPVTSSPEGLLLDFSVSFLDDAKAVITDPAYGASLVSISDSFSVSVEKKIVVPNQGAICWSQYSSRFNTIFLLDAGHPNITLVDPNTGAIKGMSVGDAAMKGSLDAILDRSYLYVLRGASFVSVVDNEGLNHGVLPREVQNLDLSTLGSRQGWMGMAVYPSS